MAAESRPIYCAAALNGLKRNSTKLLITMCIGIALAFYGVYVQARSQSNPSYMPTISIASHWIYKAIGKQAIKHPTHMLTGCFNKQLAKGGSFNALMHYLVMPIVHFSGIINGITNIIQIVLLKVYCRDICATNVTIGLSVFGFIISMICLSGSYASCKLMCISCLGIHHMVIIYLALRRRNILMNIECPQSNTSEGACTYGRPSGKSGMVFGTDNRGSAGQMRRRSGRP